MNALTEYFLEAVEGVRENKQRFAEAEAQAILKPKFPMGGFSASYVMRNFTGHAGGEE